MEEPEAGLPGELPELAPWAHKLGQALVEVLAGDRPLTHLVAWTSEQVYAQVAERAPAYGSGRAAGSGSGSGRAGQAAGGQNPPRPSTRVRPRVRSVRVYQPSANAAEVTVVAHDGGRLRAAALRLEATRDRWLCTAMELGW